jgi:hypothetical protein
VKLTRRDKSFVICLLKFTMDHNCTKNWLEAVCQFALKYLQGTGTPEGEYLAACNYCRIPIDRASHFCAWCGNEAFSKPEEEGE